MSKDNNLVKLRSFFNTVAISSQELLIDINHSLSQKVLYNLDFSVIYPFIVQHSDHNSPLFDACSKEFCASIITQRAKLPYDVIVTSATFWEMILSFHRRAEEYQAHNSASYDEEIKKAIEQIEQKISIHSEDGILRKDIMNELYKLERRTSAGFTRQIDRTRSLFADNGPIKGLGDIFKNPSAHFSIDSQEFEDLFNKMWTHRASRDNRDTILKEARYKVDVANILISQHVSAKNNAVMMDYVTKAQYKEAFCDDIGRLPLVPFYWLKCLSIGDVRDNKDAIDYFRKMNRDSKEICKILSRMDAVPDDNSLNTRQMRAFTEYFRDVLYITDNSQSHASKDIAQSMLRSLTLGHEKSRIDKSIKGLVDAAETIIGDDLMLKTGLNENGVFVPFIQRKPGPE